MKNTRSNINEKCYGCSHYGFCQIYWGTECRRHGGKRIPRLKTRLLDKQNAPSKNKIVQKHASSQLNRKTFEPIRTRRVNWIL